MNVALVDRLELGRGITFTVAHFVLGIIILTALAPGALEAQPVPVPGPNINLMAGPAELSLNPFKLTGEVILKQQNEISCDTPGGNRWLCLFNSYALVLDVPGIDPSEVTKDAWIGIAQTSGGGWSSGVLPGSPIDPRPSTIKDLIHPRAASDPTVRCFPGACVATGIFFKGDGGKGAFVAMYFVDIPESETDPQPLKLVKTVVIQMGADTTGRGVFNDKGWLAIGKDPGAATCTLSATGSSGQTLTRTVPDYPVHTVWTQFTGNNNNNNNNTEAWYAGLTRCGASVSTNKKLSASFSVNQAASIAFQPTTNRLGVVWRLFKSGSEPDALLSSFSSDDGKSWSPPVIAQTICPMQQDTSSYTARVNSFPTLTVNKNSFYVFWSDRRAPGTGACPTVTTGNVGDPGPGSRILMSKYAGTSWSQPIQVNEPASGLGAQIQPAAAVANDRWLTLIWNDFRNDASGLFEAYRISERKLLDKNSGLPFPRKHHTVEVWSAMADLNALDAATGMPIFGTAVPVTQFKQFVMPGGKKVTQSSVFNAKMNKKMTVPFYGDYSDLSAADKYLPPDPNATPPRPNWTRNIGQAGAPVVPRLFAGWTDNRNVKRVVGNPNDPTQPDLWSAPILPLYTDGQPSIVDPTQTSVVCNPASGKVSTGSQNQDVYGAFITSQTATNGVVAFSPTDSKTLGSKPVSFVIVVSNTNLGSVTVQLRIPSPPAGGTARILPEKSTTVELTIKARSSLTRMVEVAPLDPPQSPALAPNAQVRVDVYQSPATFLTSVWLNPDPNAPSTSTTNEVHTPEFDFIGFETFNHTLGLSTDVKSPEVGDPEVGDPEVGDPEVGDPEVGDPEVGDPEVGDPEVGDPEVGDNSITDSNYRITSNGNAWSGFSLKSIIQNLDQSHKFQLLVRRVESIGVPRSCTPMQIGTNQILVNTNWQFPGDFTGQDVSFPVAPGGGQVFVTVRSFNTQGPFNPANAALQVSAQAAETTLPLLTLPAVIYEATSAAGAVVNYVATAIDINGSTKIANAPGFTCSPAPDFTFPLGTTSVSCSAANLNGTATGSFTVTIVDTTGPVLSLPANMTAEATSPAGAAVSYVASASDAVDGSEPTSCLPASGGTFGLGITTVICKAGDNHNNLTSGSFTVTVRDTTPPVIAAHSPVSLEATSAAGALVTYTSPATLDVVGGAGVASCSPASGSMFVFGDTTVTCTATDAAGNTATPTTFIVHVGDTTAPVIAAHSNVNAVATSTAGALVTYTSPTTADLVDGPRTATCTPASGSQFPIGSTTVTCTATDSHGNVATPTSFAVIVVLPQYSFVNVNNLPPPGGKTFNPGSAIPLRWQFTVNGVVVDSSGAQVTIQIGPDNFTPATPGQSTFQTPTASNNYTWGLNFKAVDNVTGANLPIGDYTVVIRSGFTGQTFTIGPLKLK